MWLLHVFRICVHVRQTDDRNGLCTIQTTELKASVRRVWDLFVVFVLLHYVTQRRDKFSAHPDRVSGNYSCRFFVCKQVFSYWAKKNAFDVTGVARLSNHTFEDTCKYAFVPSAGWVGNDVPRSGRLPKSQTAYDYRTQSMF